MGAVKSFFTDKQVKHDDEGNQRLKEVAIGVGPYMHSMHHDCYGAWNAPYRI